MITFKNLENISTDTLLNTFNEAFSVYMIPMNLSKETFEWKIKSENFNPKYSVGAFDKEQLVGLILHCTDDKNAPEIIYNGGTGVIESYRSQSITQRMYEYIIPFMKADGYNKVMLEVIEGNLPAYHTYLKIGFEEVRKFNSFKGLPQLNHTNTLVKIQIEDEFDAYEYQSFGTTQPSWQNANHSLNRVANTLKLITAKLESTTVGYIIYNPQLKRINQIAVLQQYRNQGIGQALIHYILDSFSEEINIINIDEDDANTIQFFKSRGLTNHVNLFEMVKEIK